MPMADQPDNGDLYLRTLIYGSEKTKKTWWACRAAETGFNVILFDGDDGRHIVKQLPLEARKRILTVNCVDQRQRAVFALFMASFSRKDNEFLWDENTRCSVPMRAVRDPSHSYVLFNPQRFTGNDVVILDSWTALAASTLLQYAIEQEMDLTATEKEGDQFALLGFQSRFLDYVLNSIHSLPCHLIVIGHAYNYEKFKGKGKERTVVSSTIQPISSTGPHGQKLGKHFSDVLYFRQMSKTAFKIEASGDTDRAGGSRLIPPSVYDWDKLPPAELLKAVGAKPTGETCQGAVYIPPGGEMPVMAKSTTTFTQAKEMAKTTVSANEAPVLPASGNSFLQRLKK